MSSSKAPTSFAAAAKKNTATGTGSTSTPTHKLARSPIHNTMQERIHFFFLSLLGQVVVVHVAPQGHAYEGLFYAFQPHKDTFHIVLRCVRRRTINKLRDFDQEQKVIDVFEIPHTDILQITAKDVMFATEDRKFRADGFRTDTQIRSASAHGDGRELVKWEGDEALNPRDALSAMAASGSDRHFDQYAANAKFGIKSTYDENLYTTPLDTSDPERLKKAEKQAAEIEKSKFMSDNIHVREDRGFVDNTLTEEDRYSTVIRDQKPSAHQKRGPNAYTPPHQRPKDTPPKEVPSKEKPSAEPAAQKDAPKPTVEKQQQKPADSQPGKAKKALNPNAKEFTPFTANPSPPMGGGAPYGGPNQYPYPYFMPNPPFMGGMPPFGHQNYGMQQPPQQQQSHPNTGKHINNTMQQNFHQQHQNSSPPHGSSMTMPHDKKTSFRPKDPKTESK